MMTPREISSVLTQAALHGETARLLFNEARHQERCGDLDAASELHVDCDYHLTLRDRLLASVFPPLSVRAAAS
jgi:hypothetical protein